MDIIKLNPENIENQHICCGLSDKKLVSGVDCKKEWLIEEFKVGYIFKKLDVRGKVFIEYVDSEYAWLPIEANNYKVINCYWVSGRYKGRGYGRALLDECIKDSKNKDGLVVVTGSKKKPYLNDSSFFRKQGFIKCDEMLPYFELWYLPLKENSLEPRFRRVEKIENQDDMVAYYTFGCPFTKYYIEELLPNLAIKNGYTLKLVHLDTREKARNHIVPYTNFSLFYRGNFLTHEIVSEKNFTRLVEDRIAKLGESS